MDDAPRPGALAARDAGELLHAVVADIGESLDLWSVDLWTFSDDADTLECRAYWCREQHAAGAATVWALWSGWTRATTCAAWCWRRRSSSGTSATTFRRPTPRR